MLILSNSDAQFLSRDISMADSPEEDTSVNME